MAEGLRARPAMHWMCGTVDQLRRKWSGSMTVKNSVNRFWQACLEVSPDSLAGRSWEAWHFCDQEQPANELAELARTGIKTATSSLLWAYEAEGAPVPKPGDLSIITTWDGQAVCLIETTDVVIWPFSDVDESIAFEEGEGDRSLAYWRRVHWEAFSRECALLGSEPEETMPVVSERFRVLFPLPE